MNSTNIKINYLLLERILKLTKMYTKLCAECSTLPAIFKSARGGKLSKRFENTVGYLLDITGLGNEYWLGEKRLKLGIRFLKPKYYSFEKGGVTIGTIDNVNLSSDVDGVIYDEIVANPLSIEPEKIYVCVYKLGESEGKNIPYETEDLIQDIYSLDGLLKVILGNMRKNEAVHFNSKNIYLQKEWKPFFTKNKKPTQEGISFSPRYLEIRPGVELKTLINNLWAYQNTLNYLKSLKIKIFDI